MISWTHPLLRTCSDFWAVKSYVVFPSCNIPFKVLTRIMTGTLGWNPHIMPIASVAETQQLAFACPPCACVGFSTRSQKSPRPFRKKSIHGYTVVFCILIVPSIPRFEPVSIHPHSLEVKFNLTIQNEWKHLCECNMKVVNKIISLNDSITSAAALKESWGFWCRVFESSDRDWSSCRTL